MQAQHWQLLAQLADGQRHHIRSLAQQLALHPQRLNVLWQQMPPHVRGLLRQHDGYWHLVRPLAMLPESSLSSIAAEHGFQAALLPQCASTNNEILALARQSPTAAHRRLCVSYEQSAGRGRQGRQWLSRSGECLMLSIGWTFDLPLPQLGGLALVTALAIHAALQDLGVAVHIKWPNDIVLGPDKMGGILIETVPQGAQTVAVIGIGLNFVLPKAVPGAAAIQNVAPHTRCADVYRRLLHHLSLLLPQFNQHGFAPFQAAYEAAHRDQNRPVHILQQQSVLHQGIALGIAADGSLRLLTDNGEKHIVSGEISLRPGPAAAEPAAVAPNKYLLLDGGNSKLKWMWVEQGRPLHSGRAAYNDLSQLGADWQQYGAGTTRIIGSAVCGPEKQAKVAQQLPQAVEWQSSMSEALGIRNHYRNPQEHGADRWFNILGSRRYSEHACVVVSVGTAVTVDALTADNHYLGGSILPGFHLMKEAMAERTANLNRPLGRPYPFATTPPNALASGIMDAVCGAIVLMHQRLQNRGGGTQKTDVILTGGGAAKVAAALPPQFVLDNRVEIVDNLVIYGLLNWVEHT
ncbi:biotin-[acetyl-CoA-carboxylase] ligase/type 3 pantothenate kinase [Neisseria sp. HSC-16F19]|nr:biotin--[acetyl-CoA-carboxylase] ligase [Neisseria sp. HSC-16F19]MCP2040051.1 biotin-[acetyl-CoA-carboxylase] ligase/type 3 pantothenate kinase [Neisseria sp. HSC-16F19]